MPLGPSLGGAQKAGTYSEKVCFKNCFKKADEQSVLLILPHLIHYSWSALLSALYALLYGNTISAMAWIAVPYPCCPTILSPQHDGTTSLGLRLQSSFVTC